MTPREAIMQAIRTNLAASANLPVHPAATPANARSSGSSETTDLMPVASFRERLESVGGRCVVVSNQEDATRALTGILAGLQSAKRIAISDAPLVSQLLTHSRFAEMTVCPTASDLFSYDVGISSAQAGIAETGTLILEAEQERNRFVSLLPPVHIAIIKAADIHSTIGDALAALHTKDEMSRAITFITGPSRTADIELTLTVGVHGPKELHVIVIDESD